MRNLIKKNPKYSKRINYDALKDLFVEGGGPPSFAKGMGLGSDEKDDEELYTMDDRSDGGGAGMVIIEEEAGVVARAPAAPGSRPKVPGLEDGDADADADVDYGSDKADDVGGWEDAYEQEV